MNLGVGIDIHTAMLENALPPADPWATPQKAAAILTSLGVMSRTDFLLDAGDGDSYTSGQQWLDVSGNGNHFWRGANNTSEGGDPTFNGVANSISASNYFSFDGNDVFTSVNTIMANAHKDNGKWWLAFWFYFTSFGTQQALCGNTGGNNANPGIELNVTTGRLLQVGWRTGTGAGSQSDADHPLVANKWNFVSLSFEEGFLGNDDDNTPGGIHYSNNGQHDRDNSVITSPSAAAPNLSFVLGRRGGSSSPLLSGGRLAMAMGGDGDALAKEELLAIYGATRSRFSV